MPESSLELDVLIFGGGAAGLWLLDELHRREFRTALIETNALGAGQTIASQGILHGGLKYALAGKLTGSAASVADMTPFWRASLEGKAHPDLRSVGVLSPCCHLWRTDSLRSLLGLAGAKIGLRTPARIIRKEEVPPALAGCPGDVLRVDEQVIDAGSLLSCFTRTHSKRLFKINQLDEVDFDVTSAGCVKDIRIRRPDSGEAMLVKARTLVLAAGEGNEELRNRLSLPRAVMQRRPLHMVLLRESRLAQPGDFQDDSLKNSKTALPLLYGHCVDANRTRATITTVYDQSQRRIWQVGGEVAEHGTSLASSDLIAHAHRELSSILPEVNFRHTEWAAYRVNRAEGGRPDGRRPDGPVWFREGATITAWPTKLVLVPQLAQRVADSLDFAPSRETTLDHHTESWPRPDVARPPWELIDEWQT